ncbi:hypothetical protein H4R33_004278 [Dimargaris cristalligena]|nr:hypothetical protein H4R33_004278 [Dimargaris cristalligena]
MEPADSPAASPELALTPNELRLAQRIQRQVLQMVPLHLLDFSPDDFSVTLMDQGETGELAHMAFQSWIAEELLNHPLMQRYPPPPTYLRGFLKRYLALVERLEPAAEVNEALLATYIDLLGQIPASQDGRPLDRCYKTYLPSTGSPRNNLPAETSITLQEEQMMICRGTTGLRTWEASLRLAEYVIQEGQALVQERAVVELGSGTGLVGLVSALVGATRVTMSDYNPEVLDLLRDNIALNSDRLPCPVEVRRLDWTKFSVADLTSFRESTVLGADLVYDPSIIPALVDILHAFVTLDCQVYVASTIRNATTFQLFRDTLGIWSYCYDLYEGQS